MDEEFVPMHGKDSAQKEGFDLENENSEEEMSEDGSDLSDGGCEGGSGEVGHWGSLPDVCLRQVFRCLPDGDRRSADMVCRHWHNVMRSPSLWRYRFFHFSGRLSKYRQSEYCSAVAYARYLGVYLERLEVCVCPPRRSLVAQRLEQAISGLFYELTRVRAPLQSLSLVRLELDRSAWTLGLRNCLIDSLIRFLHRGASRLTSVCLNGMRNRTTQGLDLLSALSYSQRRFEPRCYISFLDLEGFFSSGVHIHLDSSVPGVLRELQGLTSLKLSYSCLSDELLMALQPARGRRQNSSRAGSALQAFSLNCTLNETHRQVVCGDTWAALASSCPDLRVKLTVDQIINTDRLARILLREIPLTEFAMTAFYSPDEDWSARPLLRRMLPQYRCSLQYLTLDLSNCSESLDEELLELVKVCERLEQLRVWAFLEIRTVERLLHIRLTQRHLLNKIRVRVYSVNDNTGEQEDQLEEILSSYQHLPPELEFYAIIYPFV
ncbi:F-box only protein 39 [Lates calcarifer]|uniref:F-box only protein 39 n=1 Tax=Lates calcarifer TaxID=8187 RepID=A0A4W6D9R7_LATCA|nr:F-box only protein 39 [Lates calcarifer]